MSVRSALFVLSCLFLSSIAMPLWAKKKPRKRPAKSRLSSAKKDEPELLRKKSFRTRNCWLLYKKIRKESISRWIALRPRLELFQCDEAKWRQCQEESTDDCESKALKKRWDSCYRIDRRLFVLTRRLIEQKEEGLKNRCRWQLKLPKERFIQPRFSPDPTRFKQRRR